MTLNDAVAVEDSGSDATVARTIRGEGSYGMGTGPVQPNAESSVSGASGTMMSAGYGVMKITDRPHRICTVS